MKEILDTEILDRSMWETYNTMKNDNFKFQGYSTDDINMMINHILPYFEKIEEYEICVELKNKIDMKPQPIKEGKTKSNSKPFTGEGRQAPPPPKPPKRATNI